MSDVQTLVNRLNSLVSDYYHVSDEDTRVVITNLTGIYHELSKVVVAQARELDHWARAARDAEDVRDEERDKRLDAECTADGLAAELAEAQAHVLRLQAAVECPEHPDNEGQP